ncbi:phasin family protein [Rhizobium leguminosarum bv. trifolii CB782]|uniref:Phasin family protein n=1 Tax=Rhizobium hidalgonense TaxID=1538159 RepID=A0A2A6KI01_9HYPH|nr:phasin family protein [Rhizobium hidalgonense]AHG45247.1 phasin family protein [Rhizobium leguminosarum bv. trifolii CB782]EJC72802.1 Phasin protein [Rhizobium leguminosarum bv. trifolii WSM2012]MDR9774562.1 phasin family protein [Rhizobium hidalgonense]MDR9805305.1 phasin family protein [Rhizobium hidalgonense]MDR9809450.1 phasin family protein [Rhizobium hidalgonense]
MFNFDDANRKSKEAVDTALRTYSDTTRGFQAIAAEAADYSKKSFQDAVTHFETLAGVKSFEAAFELQTNYVKSYFEGLVSETTKLSEMYADLAKSAYKPYEAPIATAVAKTTRQAPPATPAAA